jgi:hypothetical protein
MPSKKTDTKGFTTENPDVQTDIGAKGGPAIGLGNPDAKHGISHPYDSDLQTQIAAKSRKKSTLPQDGKQKTK